MTRLATAVLTAATATTLALSVTTGPVEAGVPAPLSQATGATDPGTGDEGAGGGDGEETTGDAHWG